MPLNDPPLIIRLKQIRADCNYGKCKHSTAAGRKRSIDNFLCIPTVIVGIIVSSAFFATLSTSFPTELKWILGIVGVTSSVLIGIRQHLNLTKISQGHVDAANNYRHLGKKCSNEIAKFENSVISPEQLAIIVDEFSSLYETFTSEAEKYPTSPSDYKKCKAAIDSRQEQYTQAELEII